jgi:hypothetical protein
MAVWRGGPISACANGGAHKGYTEPIPMWSLSWWATRGCHCSARTLWALLLQGLYQGLCRVQTSWESIPHCMSSVHDRGWERWPRWCAIVFCLWVESRTQHIPFSDHGRSRSTNWYLGRAVWDLGRTRNSGILGPPPLSQVSTPDCNIQLCLTDWLQLDASSRHLWTEKISKTRQLLCAHYRNAITYGAKFASNQLL